MKVVVLAGGISPERDVSLSSGRMIYQALKGKGHQTVLLDVYLGYNAYPGYAGGKAAAVFDLEEDWSREIGAVAAENPDIARIKAMRPDGEKNFFGPNVIAICQAADVVFIALHGESGENGKIQACFDLMGITYTGTDYISSALSMDKGLAKELFRYHGIPTPAGISLKKNELQKDKFTYQDKLVYPCIVKANNGGSSVGVCIANNEMEFAAALAEASAYDDEVIVEQFIKGREFSVGVMDGKALPVIEIAPLQGFYDYKNKYQAGSAIETCPAHLLPEKALEMQQCAEKVFRVLRMKSYARMDFMMNEDGEIFCLEANTLPGMTPTSLLPQEAAAAGMTFPELCEKIMASALKV